MQIKKMSHLGVVTKNMESALTMYRDVFGASVSPVSDKEEMGVHVAFVELAGTEIELFQPMDVRPSGSVGEMFQQFLEIRGEGIHHVSWEVEDIDAALADLKTKALHLLDQQARNGLHGRIAFIDEASCCGIRTELVEPYGEH